MRFTSFPSGRAYFTHFLRRALITARPSHTHLQPINPPSLWSENTHLLVLVTRLHSLNTAESIICGFIYRDKTVMCYTHHSKVLLHCVEHIYLQRGSSTRSMSCLSVWSSHASWLPSIAYAWRSIARLYFGCKSCKATRGAQFTYSRRRVC